MAASSCVQLIASCQTRGDILQPLSINPLLGSDSDRMLHDASLSCCLLPARRDVGLWRCLSVFSLSFGLRGLRLIPFGATALRGGRFGAAWNSHRLPKTRAGRTGTRTTEGPLTQGPRGLGAALARPKRGRGTSVGQSTVTAGALSTASGAWWSHGPEPWPMLDTLLPFAAGEIAATSY